MRIASTVALILACVGRMGTLSPAGAGESTPPAFGVGTLAVETPLEEAFRRPPDSARPWVYWFFMDGNLTREGISADLEAMRQAGIGGAIILEVGIGIPRGPVEFMSEPWRKLLKHAIAEADRLGLEIALGAGPGWCGTGGPWIKPEQSMQHLVASETTVSGPVRFDAALPRPKPRTPFFGEATLTPELAKQWREFYRDVAVLAFPTPQGSFRIADVDEKSLYYRAPYSSQPGVKPFLSPPADDSRLPPEQCIASKGIVDLTAQLGPDGRLVWDVPAGPWTILRFGRTLTGQTTRPAPAPGLGLESDKFDTTAIDAHFAAFIETLLNTVREPQAPSEKGRPDDARQGKGETADVSPRGATMPGRGLTTLHFDSWEMSSQNWSQRFREQFTRRRGYDPLHYLPVMTGRVVDNEETSERFLWDLRQTAQELVVENHVGRLKELGSRRGLQLSIEPYDLNPCADLKLGGVADVPMCEFWSKGLGFSAEFSVIEAASIAHTLGRPIIAAESFTALPEERWRQHPGSMKAQGDWALCAGINRFVFHRFQAQPWLDRFPGMTMGPYGVHWDRTQTWWDMVGAYHLYLARCQQMLRRGRFVADILYLAPEGAPHVFRPPASAIEGDPPDRRGYNFDGCDPDALIAHAKVSDGRIVFPHGMSYRVLVLPRFPTMTPRLLGAIRDLVEAGATVIGSPPHKSPSLVGYPDCDRQVRELAAQIWGAGAASASRRVGKGRVIHDPVAADTPPPNPLAEAKWIWYPEDNPTAAAPVGKRLFQRTIEIDGARAIQSAEVTMTADNRFELFVNGRSVASGDNFHVARTIDVAASLKPGANVIAVTAENDGDRPNPAALIGSLTVRYRNGSALAVPTDRRWTSSRSADDAPKPAMELGPVGMAPWNLSGPAAEMRDIYPDYASTVRVLSEMGVPADFNADGEVRYIHRSDKDAELYFVASREDRARNITCRFRVRGLQPEWWDPLTGDCRPLPEFEEKDGITTVPLRLEALESGLVVFRHPAAKPRRAGKNFPELRSTATLAGPWEVSFDPKWGGPETIAFAKLEDWSNHSEAGIRSYSGKAVYRTTFALGKAATDQRGKRFYLSLGSVKNLASVRINGKDLGVVWCAPWRVEIPADAIKAEGNALEITVANLWINRLIADSALPEGKRLTWTTWNPFKADSPREPSGLLGPVEILTSAP